MGVSGNFLAVALPGLTKHSPSQNPVNFRACYPIIEKKDGGGPCHFTVSPKSLLQTQVLGLGLGLDNIIF